VAFSRATSAVVHRFWRAASSSTQRGFDLAAGLTGSDYGACYAVSCYWNWLVFPNSDHIPAKFSQGRVIAAIARDVVLDLRRPVVGVPRRHSPMLFTSVPKAAVYEDTHLHRRKDDVGGASKVLRRPSMYEKPEAPPMEL
jgi:hypothetical protein